MESQMTADPVVSQSKGSNTQTVEVKTPAETGAASQPLIISEQDAPLVMDFIAEAMEHVETAEASLLELETKPGDNEVLNKIFRGFHTIKGMAGFLNLTEIGTLAHAAENILDLARKGKMVIVGPISDIIFEVIDAKKKMLAILKDCLQASKPVPSYSAAGELMAKLKLAAEGKLAQSVPAALPKTEQQPTIQLTPEVVQQPTLQTTPQPTPQTASQPTTPQAIQPQATQPTAAGQQETTESHDNKESIKVSTIRLDKLINTVGELVIAQLMVAEQTSTSSLDSDLSRKVVHQSKIIRELQELSMVMRMVPIQGVFQKMARIVRDLSHKTGKQIDFVTRGEETELDRNIVDKITDPLVHMIRNSVDHGVETPEERVKAGKKPVGRVELRAYHQAGNIVIEIQDDGKGLNKERILQKAIEGGFVEAGQQLSDEEIFKFVFRPGLSTAEKVTAVSGRGVGMDVVKRNIDSLRGKIEISSTPGQGSTFTIRLPLTLAIIDGQIVRVGKERYIVPIGSIIHSFRPTKEQVQSIQRSAEVAMVSNELLPIIRLHRHFNIQPQSNDICDSLLVVVEADGAKCCVLVDDLLGQQQVVIKSLGEGLGKVMGVAGGAIMGDGRVCLILDVPGLVELARKTKS
jgi:two-component system, chemotaxis family, sensor kinase CheA